MMLQTNSTDSLSRVLQRSLLRGGVGIFSLLVVLSGGLSARSQDSSEPLPEVPAEEVAPVLRKQSAQSETPPSRLDTVPTAPAATSKPDISSSTASSVESYIDSTSYSVGATRPSSEQPRTARLPSTPTTVQVGPLTASSYGLSFGTTASVRDYYKRTLRPPGRLGNGNIRLIFPLSIPSPITSLFGWRIHPLTGEQRFHSGTDLGAPVGTPVLAAYAGRVALADFLGGYGLAILLEHNKGTEQTLYGHMSEIFVKPGEWVNQGSVIGRVGNTGLSTGPHLHFEFHQKTPAGWVALDPGEQLEYALAQLMKTMGVAKLPSAPASTTQTLELDLSATLDVNLQDQS